jgi:hypothetical protein
MNRPTVVFDTNVVVSAAVNSGGLEARMVELVAALILYGRGSGLPDERQPRSHA